MSDSTSYEEDYSSPTVYIHEEKPGADKQFFGYRTGRDHPRIDS